MIFSKIGTRFVITEIRVIKRNTMRSNAEMIGTQ
jgi:hypothetical protein